MVIYRTRVDGCNLCHCYHLSQYTIKLIFSVVILSVNLRNQNIDHLDVYSFQGDHFSKNMFSGCRENRSEHHKTPISDENCPF